MEKRSDTMGKLFFYRKENKIALLLSWLCIPRNRKGRLYLQAALELIQRGGPFKKEICSLVADQYGVDSTSVQRRIWTAVNLGRRFCPEHFQMLEILYPERPMPPLNALLHCMTAWLERFSPVYEEASYDSIQWWYRII